MSTSLIIALVCIIPAWFIQNCIHEASHLFFAWKAQGRRAIGFWPYPHIHGDHFFFARCRWGEKTKDGHKGWIFIAPFIFASVWLVINIFLSFFHLLFLAFSVVALIDALWFWRGYFFGTKKSDGKRFRESMK